MRAAADVLKAMVGLNGVSGEGILRVAPVLAAFIVGGLLWVNLLPNSWQIQPRPKLRYALLLGIVLAACAARAEQAEPVPVRAVLGGGGGPCSRTPAGPHRARRARGGAGRRHRAARLRPAGDRPTCSTTRPGPTRAPPAGSGRSSPPWAATRARASPAAGCRPPSGSRSGRPRGWPTSSTSPPASRPATCTRRSTSGCCTAWLPVTGQARLGGAGAQPRVRGVHHARHLRPGARPRVRAARGRARRARLGREPRRGRASRPSRASTTWSRWPPCCSCGASWARRPSAARGARAGSTSVWLAAATAAALLTHYQAVLLVAGAAVSCLAGALLPARGRPPRRALVAAAARACSPARSAAALLAPGWSQAFSRERAKRLQELLHPRPSSRSSPPSAPRFARFARRCPISRRWVVTSPRSSCTAGRRSCSCRVPAARLTERVRQARPGWWTVALLPRGHRRRRVPAEPAVPEHAAAHQRPVPRHGLAVRRVPAAAGVRAVAAGTLRAHRGLLPAGAAADDRRRPAAARLRRPPADRSGSPDADAVLVDNVGVGELPRFLWYVPADARVFAGTQEQLLADQEAWRDRPSARSAYYVSILRSGGVPLAPRPHPGQPAQDSTTSRRWRTQRDGGDLRDHAGRGQRSAVT